MWRTRVRTVAQESASLQAFVPWCSSCNSLILRNGEVTWRSELLQRLQEVRGNCKTRNLLNYLSLVLAAPVCFGNSKRTLRVLRLQRGQRLTLLYIGTRKPV